MTASRPAPRRPALLALLGGLSACSGEAWVPVEGTLRCDPRELAAGEVRIKQIGCADERLVGGDATTGDWLLGNASVRFALRYGTALTRFETSGGTVVDASLPGRRDGLREATPLFETDAGFEPLSSAEAVPLEERIGGTVVAVGLEVMGTTPSGAEHWFRWSLSEDADALEIEGADAVEVLPLAPAEWVGPVVEVDPDQDDTIEVLVGMDGKPQGSGAARTFVDPSLLVAGTRSLVHDRLWPDGTAVSGLSNARWIDALDSDNLRTARLAVEGDRFQGRVPTSTTALRPARAGWRDGELVSPGTDLTLPLGPEGRLDLTVRDTDGRPLAATVLWQGASHATDLGGGTLDLPPGSGPITVHAGPAYESITLSPVRILERPSLSVSLERVQPDHALIGIFGLLTAPDRGPLRSSTQAVEEAVARGASVVVVSARDEVAPRAEPLRLSREIVVWAGTTADPPEGSLLAFPYSGSARHPAHGAAPWPTLDPLGVLSWMGRSGRLVAVSSQWVEAAGPPWTWPLLPQFLVLDHPEDQTAWLNLLDQGTDLAPLGPVTWLEGFDAQDLNPTEAARALTGGAIAAGNGPRVTLSRRPLQDADANTARFDVTCSGPTWMPITAVELVGPEGVVATVEASQPRPPQVSATWVEADPPDWVVARCLGDANPPLAPEPLWAVSSPVFLQRP